MAGSSGVTIIITSSIDGRLRGAQLCLFMLLDTMTFGGSVCIPKTLNFFGQWALACIEIWSEWRNNLVEMIKEFAQNKAWLQTYLS